MTEDCISRAEAQKHIYTRLYESALNNVGYKCDASDIFTDIAENRLGTWILEIPSLQPKTGHWIDHQEDKWIYAQCSECETVHDTRTNYCPNCGCRMVEPQESEDTVPFDFELYQAGLMDMPKGMIEVLDKIRAEIEQMNNIDYVEPVTVDEVLKIIDKYKAESENEE